MAKSRLFIFNNDAQEKGHFVAEKLRVERYFPCFQCELQINRLLCRGVITPADGCDSYHIRIYYVQSRIPRVYISRPTIKPSPEYHMYGDGSLCLYDPRETPWSSKLMLHETIIPWTAEWIVFYELWKVTGKWLGPAAPHGPGEKIPDR